MLQGQRHNPLAHLLRPAGTPACSLAFEYQREAEYWWQAGVS